MLLWLVVSFLSLLKHVRILVKKTPRLFLVSQVIQNYVGLSSSLRIRRSKSLTFVGRPIISIILTLRSCDVRRQIMVILHTFSPSRGNCVRWRAEINYGHSGPFHPGSIVSGCTQKKIMVVMHLLSSRGGEPDDMRRQIMVIRSPFCHPESIESGGTQR